MYSFVVVYFGVFLAILEMDMDGCRPPWRSYEWAYLLHLGGGIFWEITNDIFQVRDDPVAFRSYGAFYAERDGIPFRQSLHSRECSQDLALEPYMGRR